MYALYVGIHVLETVNDASVHLYLNQPIIGLVCFPLNCLHHGIPWLEPCGYFRHLLTSSYYTSCHLYKVEEVA